MNTMQAKDIQAYLGAYRKEAWDPKRCTRGINGFWS